MGIMGIIDEVKSIAKTVQQIDNIELYRNILNLQAQIMNLVDENSKLKAEISSLKEKLVIKENLIFHDDTYWISDPDGKEDGPFCSNCWDTKQLIVRMLFCGNKEYSECPTCKKPIKIRRL